MVDMTPKERAHDFFSTAPKYRTKDRLVQSFREAEDAAYERAAKTADEIENAMGSPWVIPGIARQIRALKHKDG